MSQNSLDISDHQNLDNPQNYRAIKSSNQNLIKVEEEDEEERMKRAFEENDMGYNDEELNLNMKLISRQSESIQPSLSVINSLSGNKG